jgi:phosphoribosyl 1,2-cyclic phosphate phosphodiesterase
VVEGSDGSVILVDTPPEIRLQLVNADVPNVDAVLYTHDHADHIHGIDDLRAISVRQGELPVYGPPETLEKLEQRFGYIFDASVVPSPGTTKPHLTRNPLEAGTEVSIGGQVVLPLEVDHGGSRVYGYRFGNLAYLTDVKSVPPHTRRALEGVEVFVINALFEKQHPTHLSIGEAVALAAEVGADRTFLTHLTHDFDHAELESRLPEGVELAYDGLSVVF